MVAMVGTRDSLVPCWPEFLNRLDEVAITHLIKDSDANFGGQVSKACNSSNTSEKQQRVLIPHGVSQCWHVSQPCMFHVAHHLLAIAVRALSGSASRWTQSRFAS
eukprot:3922115-Amphidinium_carterae.1